jgi:ribosomal protein S18 acetylase RimI-like enzyme
LQLAVDNERARLFYERLGFLPRAYELLDKPLRENAGGSAATLRGI